MFHVHKTSITFFQRLCMCFHQRVLLANTSVVNLKPPQATLINQKRRSEHYYRQKIITLHYDYKWSYQEWAFRYKQRKREKAKKEILSYFTPKGSISEIGQFVLGKGGKLKLKNDDIWYKTLESGHSPFTVRQLDTSIIEGLDLPDIDLPNVWIDKICVDSIRLFRYNNSPMFDNWCISIVVNSCPNLEALNIRGCTGVTDTGLELLHQLKHLKVLDITGCTGVQFAEAVCAFLSDFCPDLIVLGLDSLQEIDKSHDLSHHEQYNSRYMNWGHILDHRLGLTNCEFLANSETNCVQTEHVDTDNRTDEKTRNHLTDSDENEVLNKNV